ncbi:MAG: type I DNA topoisomerase [Chloroflexi bacterium]|nr:type I DNA topoisomerase [Chloroflexota bacterium]
MTTATATTGKSTAKATGRTPRRKPEPAPPANGRARGKHAPNLVIVESPTKARTVKNILGDDYDVIASVGHVRDLPPYGYGVEDIESLNFRPKYVVVKDKRRGVDKNEVVADIARAAKAASRIFIATDPDREGEAIAWHIKEAAGIPDEKSTRVVFHEITKPAIEAAFAEAMGEQVATNADGHQRKAPGKIDMDLVDAQQARRVLDRLIGFPLTWFVQKKVSRGASAGRVQSVALGLIVNREKQIRDFRPVEYWTVHAGLAKQARAFEAELTKFAGAVKGTKLKPTFTNAGPAIPSEMAANELVAKLRRSQFRVASVARGEKKRSPAPPFTTSTFQQAAVNRLGMSAARAMSIAQELYEGVNGQAGLITYMRTDSLNISPGARLQARDFAAHTWGSDFIPAKERVYVTRSRGAQEAHEAIRPTNPSATPDSVRRTLNNDQLRVYTLIWQRFMASQMSDARYATVTIDIEATEGSTTHGTFRASSSTLTFEGHLKVYGADAAEPAAEDDEEDGLQGSLPDLAEGDVLEQRSVDGRRHQTEPPPRYTEATLVKALEEEGIGRPSTYATIVQTVLKRDYVEKQGRQLVPQELGFIVHDLLEQHMKKYVDVPFTGEMERELDEVAQGQREYDEVLNQFWPEFKRELDQAGGAAEKQQEVTSIRCNVCDQANLVIKWGRNGKFFACPRYPECTNSLPMGPDGEPVFAAAPQEIAYRCPKDGGGLVQKSGPYGQYVDCVNREKGTCDFRGGVPVGVACPEEPETGQLVQKQTKRGIFYGCWNYPNCSYTTNSLEPGKMSPARPLPEREEANKKLLERSARGKAAFAKRKTNATATRARKAS